MYICGDLRPIELSIVNNEYVQAAHTFPLSPTSTETGISYRAMRQEAQCGSLDGDPLISPSSDRDE